MDMLTESEKLDVIRDCLINMKHNLAEKGAKFFNITIKEQYSDGMGSHSGKAFSTDGKNFYGFAFDDNNPFKFYISRMFIGTYIKDKGIILNIIPFDEAFMREQIVDMPLTASARTGIDKMYGHFMNIPVSVEVLPETEKISVETHLKPFVDNWEFWKSIDDIYLNRFFMSSLKADMSDYDKMNIEKSFELEKNAPIPEGFEDDGSAPEGGSRELN